MKKKNIDGDSALYKTNKQTKPMTAKLLSLSQAGSFHRIVGQEKWTEETICLSSWASERNNE